MSLSEPNIYAAIDLGSNSFHMIVAKDDNNQIQVIDRIKDTVRLAGGLDKHNVLSDEIMENGLKALERFGQRINEIPHENVHAVGTNALRQAINSNIFLNKARLALGHPIEIISGIEEARLIFLGVAHSIFHDKKKCLVVDIGGGSTEIIIGKGFEPILSESLYMGSVSVSKRYFNDGEITAKKMRKAILHCRQELETIGTIYKNMGWEVALGSSGAVLRINEIAREKSWSDAGITKESLDKLTDVMINVGHIKKLRFESIPNNQKSVLPGGVAVLSAVFEALNLESISISDGALREGLLHDLIGRVQNKDVRVATVNNFMARYSVDVDHVKLIEITARNCFDQVQSDWQLDKKQDLKLIKWAIRLHQIGIAIAHGQYHRHGAYLINHSDMPGFSRQTQAELAILVRSHRRKFPLEEIQSMSEDNIDRILRLCIIVRFSILLHRSRSSDALPEFKLKAGNNYLKIIFPENWLDDHPLTEIDIETEAAYVSATGYKLKINKESSNNDSSDQSEK